MQDKRGLQSVLDVPLDGVVNAYGPLATAQEERRRRLGWHEIVLVLAVSVVLAWLALSSPRNPGTSGVRVADPVSQRVAASGNR